MNKEAFRKTVFSLVDRLYPMVMRYLGNQSDTKDALQDIMLKLWKKRNQLLNHPNPQGFIFLTARNHCLDILKKKKRTFVDLENIKTSDFLMNENSNSDYNELKKVILGILDNCPIQHNEVLILRDIDGLEYKEIGELIDLKVEHIRVILSRTRKYVKQELMKTYSYE